MVMQKDNGVWKVLTVTYDENPYKMNIEYPDGNDGGEADGQE